MAKMLRKVNKAALLPYQPCVMKRIALPTTALFMALALPLMAEAVPKKKSPSTSAKSKSSSSEPGKKSGAPPAQERDLDDREGGPAGEEDGPPLAAVSSIEPEELEGFDHYAPQVQELIRKALGLTRMNLSYTFGSADPKKGGMDCSGTIYYLLHDFGFKGVPRSSDLMCGWVQENTLLFRVNEADSLKHHEFASLQPGNLLFWSGTYDSAPRKIPVTHVMLYLGKLKKNGKHVVFGASDGRSYQGQRRSGVSVFDFSLPKAGSRASFYGYGLIPGIGKIKSSPPVLAAASAPASGLEKNKLAAKIPVPSERNTPPSGAGATNDNDDDGATGVKTGGKTKAKPSEISATKSGKAAESPASPDRSDSDQTSAGEMQQPTAAASKGSKSDTSVQKRDKDAESKIAADKTASSESPLKPQEEIRKAQPASSLAAVRESSTTSTASSQVKDTQSMAKNRVGSTTPQKKTAAAQSPNNSQKKTSAVKTSSTRKGSTASTRPRRQQQPAPPPTAMDRIRKAADSFASDVRRTFR